MVNMNLFQKSAFAALVAVTVLIFVGAIVRVTGAGMGCPDWPTCWGCLIPPTKVENVDFSKLDIARFQAKAARMGRDPATISIENLKREFNPRHVWTEFINRLFSLPVAFFSLTTLALSTRYRAKKPAIFVCAFISLILVLINAVMGARVVYSGLAPGVLTLHMFLAFLLLMALVLCVHLAQEQSTCLPTEHSQKLRFLIMCLFFSILIEGIMGSQIRELTDSLSKHMQVPRSEWIKTLEDSKLYLIHRSFSWLILFLAIRAFMIQKRLGISLPRSSRIVVGIVCTQMLLGLIMSQIHIYGWVQVTHVGLSAILVSSSFFWLLHSWQIAKHQA